MNSNPIDSYPAGRSVMLDQFRSEALATWKTEALKAKLADLSSFTICPAGSVMDLQKRALRAALEGR